MRGAEWGPRASRSPLPTKPIITCAGDWNLFCTLEAPLVAAIPQDSSEWRRSYGRVFKKVFVEAAFEKFSKDALPDENDWNIMRHPVFHIYWTDCTDMESYKTTTKDDIEAWFKVLAGCNVTDWMIVLVETYDIRKTNKLLPRTTVLDKIRNDFGSKHGDRCVSVINPVKSESRSAESWRCLVTRIRHLVLTSYNKSLIRFEEHMREQRDKRNESGWDFSEYFLLQEQLAFILEMLGLYDEALVQYDELDAMFTQFVLNSGAGEFPKWLSDFQKSVETWQGVCLSKTVSYKHRELIKGRRASIVEFRTYLFQRQSAMLLANSRPWEIASRCLTVVHNTIKEIQMLEVTVPIGAFACWALLTCLEVLQTCEKLALNASHQVVQQCATHQAPLWHYAKDKLWELGKLCGLLPGTPEPSSAQLHMVVTLSAGMVDIESNNSSQDSISITAIDKLKEALGSKQAFQTHYLELAELAMGTYKHIGRLRCARFIGRDLASFYSELGETSKACVFLLDALRSYEDQGWRDLAAQTRMELVSCYKKMNDYEKYTKLSATISSTCELEILVRNFYFDEMIKCIKTKIMDISQPILCEFNDCFQLIAVNILPPQRENYIKDSSVKVNIVFESLFPREVICEKACINVELYKEEDNASKKIEKKPLDKQNKTDLANLSSSSGIHASPKKVITSNLNSTDANIENEFITKFRLEDLKAKDHFQCPLSMILHLDWKEDKTLDTASVQCNNPKSKLKRSDSTKYRKQSTSQRSDFTHYFSLENFLIKPGHNEIVLENVAHEAGIFRLGQISLVIEKKLDYLSNSLLACKMCYEVITKGVDVALNKVNPKRELFAGIEHAMELIITSGSTSIDSCVIHLKASNGLTVQLQESVQKNMLRELDVDIPHCDPFTKVSIPLIVFANLPPKKDDKPIEHKIMISCPWMESPVIVTLHFTLPVSPTWKLLTSNIRKFINLTLVSLTSEHNSLAISKPKLDTEAQVTLVDLNPKNNEEYILDSNVNSISFIWELQMNPLDKSIPIKTMFSMMYRVIGGDFTTYDRKEYKCPFEMQEYQTLFLVRSKVEPMKGSEFCRASQMCYLQLSVQKVNETYHNSLMYEVLADQTMWAVCGRTAGVITMENTEPQTVTLDVMPLIAGYLPLPTVRLSKYIAASQQPAAKDGRKSDISVSHPRLEPFSPGQVYHSGKAQQVHVLANISSNELH